VGKRGASRALLKAFELEVVLAGSSVLRLVGEATGAELAAAVFSWVDRSAKGTEEETVIWSGGAQCLPHRAWAKRWDPPRGRRRLTTLLLEIEAIRKSH